MPANGDHLALTYDSATGTYVNKAPIAAHAAIVDADEDLADVTEKFNTLLQYMRDLGLVAP